MKIHYRKLCRILTQVIKEAECMHYTKQILESHNKVKAVWKTAEKETGKFSTEEVTSLMKINNIIKNPKLTEHSFNTYSLTVTERINNDTTTLMTEDAEVRY
jgi:hypothetical protein